MLQVFLRENPDFLRTRGFLTKSSIDYTRVEFLLVARDHLTWMPSSDHRAIVGFNPFKAALMKSSLSAALDCLLSYRWLPVEGKDFRIALEDATVNGVTVRSETFYPM